MKKINESLIYEIVIPEIEPFIGHALEITETSNSNALMHRDEDLSNTPHRPSKAEYSNAFATWSDQSDKLYKRREKVS